MPMQTSSGIPSSCLIAVLLVIRSSSGPSLAFHYPPNPKLEPPATIIPTTTDYPSSSSSSSGSSSEDEEPATAPRPALTDAASDSESRRSRRRRRDDATLTPGGGKKRTDADGLPWEKLLGFKTDALAGMLAPKDSAGRGKFEMSVDDMVFLGQPVHVRPDGTWRKRKKRRREQVEEEADEETKEGDGEEGYGGADELAGGHMEDEDDVDPLENSILDLNAVQDDADDEGDEGSRGRRGKEESSMGMFHVVFVLNPPELEYHFRVQEMFNCVAKRFARALKYEQAKDGYVWREAEKISRMKEQSREKGMNFSELWRQIMDKSSLAYGLSRIYSDIAHSRIAHIFLNNSIGLSLQLPMVTEISVLPSLVDRQLPGLPLTTATSFGDDEAKGDTLLAKHFTLLYLSPIDQILKDLSSASPTDISTSLSVFIKACKPTLSFFQISTQTGLPLQDIQILARHLVHWRKARAIPPIHQRDMYIVSPNADMKRLPVLIKEYTHTFPSLPALPKILSLLSGKPKPYASYIPSKDHRHAYLDILAWLLRHGLATQLRNFAWIKVPRDLKLAVNPNDLDANESFILNPAQASGRESAWLEMMTRDQPPDVKALFERLLKYLNGEHALEKIPNREGISRKDVRRVLTALERFVVYARHW